MGYFVSVILGAAAGILGYKNKQRIVNKVKEKWGEIRNCISPIPLKPIDGVIFEYLRKEIGIEDPHKRIEIILCPAERDRYLSSLKKIPEWRDSIEMASKPVFTKILAIVDGETMLKHNFYERLRYDKQWQERWPDLYEKHCLNKK